jgi:two-component system cell cycle response regulator
MTKLSTIEIATKPTVLIADDSRLVRATLIKHIEGMFDFREALDGEEAWGTLLTDPGITAVITDLKMPKLDGHGLLQKIRASKLSRIRNIPVMVISGSDEQDDRVRARNAGATDLITKGIPGAVLLARLDMLCQIGNSRSMFESTLEALVRQNRPGRFTASLATPERLRSHAAEALAAAIGNGGDFVILKIRLGIKPLRLEGLAFSPPSSVVHAIGEVLQGTVRQSDCVAQTDDVEFTLATGSITLNSARFFAERICQAVSNASLLDDHHLSFVASCGVASLLACGPDIAEVTLERLLAIARRRAEAGLHLAITGVVGPEEEAAYRSERCV